MCLVVVVVVEGAAAVAPASSPLLRPQGERGPGLRGRRGERERKRGEEAVPGAIASAVAAADSDFHI